MIDTDPGNLAGNVPVDVATVNVGRILAVAPPPAPPVVAIGAAGPRARALVTATHFHGEDGLGSLGAWFPEARIEERMCRASA